MAVRRRRRGRRRSGFVVGLLVGAMVVGLGILGFLIFADRDGTDTVGTATPTPADGDGSTGSATGTDSTDDTGTAAGAPAAPGAERLARSVVQIQLLLDGRAVCTGSGTVVDTEGTVVTNYHVVQQSSVCPHDAIGVAVAASSQSVPDLRYEADLLVFDPDLDLAVIRISRGVDGGPVDVEFEPVEVGDSDQVELGDQIRVFGFPGIGGQTITFTTGSVSGFSESPEGGERSWLKTDATIAGGNSGGLAVDEQGRFVGVPTQAGSGSGQIVDCRVIADSNGDGRTTEEDSCVPIGGFINGIRPVSLAVPLISAAATARPIDQGPPPRDEPLDPELLPFAFNPQWSSGVDDLGVPIDRVAAGNASDQRELCIVWSYEDVAEDSVHEVVWFLDGEELTELSSPAPEPIDAGGGDYYGCIFNDSGLGAGVLEFAWFVNEELIFVEGIRVGDGATAEIEVVNDSDEPLCVVQFNPSETATYGLNEIIEPIQPGGSVVFEVAVGATDGRVIDCDGAVRIEDATGFVIDEDVFLTVD